MFTRIIAPLAITAAALATTAPASARTANQETRSVTVAYAGLDLTRQDGVDALSRRLVSAAGQVCNVNGRVPLDQVAAAAACRKDALAKAAPEMQLAVARARAQVELASNGAPREKLR